MQQIWVGRKFSTPTPDSLPLLKTSMSGSFRNAVSLYQHRNNTNWRLDLPVPQRLGWALWAGGAVRSTYREPQMYTSEETAVQHKMLAERLWGCSATAPCHGPLFLVCLESHVLSSYVLIVSSESKFTLWVQPHYKWLHKVLEAKRFIARSPAQETVSWGDKHY